MQNKARLSFKKILKFNGKLDRTAFAFFYLAQTSAASNGLLFKPMNILKQKLKPFFPTWINFNQAIPAQPQSAGHNIKPTVIIVADELFTMNDQVLHTASRLSVPNTLKDGIGGGPNLSGTSRGEQQRQQDIWHATVNVVQGHLFDGKQEPQEITIFDYLMKLGHEIISFKMADRLCECWLSQRVDWHVERGLKLNTDGTAHTGQGRSTTYQYLTTMAHSQRKIFIKEAQMGTFTVTCFKPGTKTAHMVAQGTQLSAKTYAQEIHYLQLNTQAQQTQLRQKLGTEIYIGKYDIPTYNLRAPLGTSIFQFVREREFAEQNYQFLNQKYLSNLAQQAAKLTPEQKRPKYIEEPKPGPNHIICAICREQFKDYYEHIFSARHRRGVASNQHLFSQVDLTCKELDIIQAKKRQNHLNKLLTIDLSDESKPIPESKQLNMSNDVTSEDCSKSTVETTSDPENGVTFQWPTGQKNMNHFVNQKINKNTEPPPGAVTINLDSSDSEQEQNTSAREYLERSNRLPQKRNAPEPLVPVMQNNMQSPQAGSVYGTVARNPTIYQSRSKREQKAIDKAETSMYGQQLTSNQYGGKNDVFRNSSFSQIYKKN